MDIPTNGTLLRIFIGESDHWHGRPLYEELVREARKEGLAGATVTKGVAGFGKNSRIHTAHILRLSEDLPLVVEIVDADEKVRAFLPRIEAMMAEVGGLAILEPVEVHLYRHRNE